MSFSCVTLQPETTAPVNACQAVEFLLCVVMLVIKGLHWLIGLLRGILAPGSVACHACSIPPVICPMPAALSNLHGCSRKDVVTLIVICARGILQVRDAMASCDTRKIKTTLEIGQANCLCASGPECEALSFAW